MYFVEYSLIYYDETDRKNINVSGIAPCDGTYAEAVENIEKYYGDGIVKITSLHMTDDLSVYEYLTMYNIERDPS